MSDFFYAYRYRYKRYETLFTISRCRKKLDIIYRIYIYMCHALSPDVFKSLLSDTSTCKTSEKQCGDRGCQSSNSTKSELRTRYMYLQNFRESSAGTEGVKPVIQPIRAKNILKVVPFKEKSSFHFVVL